MVLDNFVIAVLKDRGLEDEAKAQEYFDGLEQPDRDSVLTLSGENRMTDKILGRLLGSDDKDGALKSILTTTLDAHTNNIDERINKLVHNRLDQHGIKTTPGADADKDNKDGKNGKDGKDGKDIEPVIPEGFVPVSKIDELRSEITQRDIRQAITSALSGEKLMPNAFDIALRELESSAEKNDNGDIVVKLKDQDNVLRSLSPESAVKTLRSRMKFLFAASLKGGTGGGEGADAGGGDSSGAPDDLPKVKSYQALLDNPKLMARYIEEAPELLEQLESGHGSKGSGELARILSGQGMDARTQVEIAFANTKNKLMAR